jgi:uncharacterized RDD family membrane protein YckC
MLAGVPAAVGAAAPPGVIALPRVGFWRRLLASLIDFMLVMMVLAALTRRPQWFPFVWIAYHLGFWIWRGTTVGGVLCRVRIVHLDGRPLGPGAAIVRLLAACFSLAMAGLGFFWAGWSAEKQSWHDQIAGTTVVRVPRGTPLL